MPLFHIHGLIAGVLAPLSAGSAHLLHAGLQRAEVLRLDGRGRPTWYTAVPTMHQAILVARRAQRGRDRAPTRCVSCARRRRRCRRRSSPNSRRTFGAPVIEAYGMTEASHQMASNPLPPAQRKPGTVGRRGRSRDRRSWTMRAAAGGRRNRRDRDPRRQRDGRLREQSRSQRRGVHRWLVPHRRPGRARRRRLPQHHRPAEGDHQPRRREDLAARGRRGADGPSGRGRRS